MIRTLTKRRRMPVCKDVPTFTAANVNAQQLTHTVEWFCSRCFKTFATRTPHPDCKASSSEMDAVVVSPLIPKLGLRYQR